MNLKCIDGINLEVKRLRNVTFFPVLTQVFKFLNTENGKVNERLKRFYFIRLYAAEIPTDVYKTY